MTREGATFAYQFGYLLGLTRFWSPSLHALGMMVRRVTSKDMQIRRSHNAKTSGGKRQSIQPQRNDVHRSETTAASSTSDSAENSVASRHGISPPSMDTELRKAVGAIVIGASCAILVKWHSVFQRGLRARRRRWIASGDSEGSELPEFTEERRRQNGDVAATTASEPAIPVPPPFPPAVLPSFAEGNNDGLDDKWRCPLCREPRINPAASTSGYVFCYRCLMLHLRNVGEHCPVTGRECPTSRVVRIYEPTAAAARRH